MPTVSVMINNNSAKALLDSGCSKSIISSQFARLLGLNLEKSSNQIVLMDGTKANSFSECVVKVSFLGKNFPVRCFVSKILSDYDILMGMDVIRSLNGVFIDKNGDVFCEQSCAAVSSLYLDDPDFFAEFSGGKWLARWKWCQEDEPVLKNQATQYKVKAEFLPDYEAEIKEWINRGWLKEFDGEHEGVIPLMAVIQANKNKVRPVLDYRELNNYVSSHTAESEVCHEKLRKWRKFGRNLGIIDLKKAYLQIHIDPSLYKYQVVVFNGTKYCLTRLGFGLNCAPKIMTSILRKVFSLDPEINAAVDSYIDDIVVNTDMVSCERVLEHLRRNGLEGKKPETLEGSRVLGLKVETTEEGLVWRRDNSVGDFGDVRTKRDLFSLCGKLIGHYPIGGWLRPASSFVKRLANNVDWDSEINGHCKAVLGEIQTKMKLSDPVRGIWEVQKEADFKVWCDASSLAIGVVLTMNGKPIEDACWLRKDDDALHINAAELESAIKGINLAIQWQITSFTVVTDSSSVFGWLKSVTERDKPVRTTGLSSMLVKRRIQILENLIREYSLSLKLNLVKSSLNIADGLTRVPEKWLKRDRCATGLESDNRDKILAEHRLHHFGVEKTLFFCRSKFPDLIFSRDAVKQVVEGCVECKSIDPQPKKIEDGELSVEKSWSRVACDVTHHGDKKFLTLIDCGPSRFAIWKRIPSEHVSLICEALEDIFRSFGPPGEIVLDNFKSFRSHQVLALLQRWNVSQWFRCAHRPSGNGIVERHHRTIKRMAARSRGNVLDMVYYYNLAPKVPGNADSSPRSRLFRFELSFCPNQRKLRSDEACEFSEGDAVYVKPAQARCTNQWPKGIVTNVNSKWNADVNGMPRHVRDLRRVNPPPCQPKPIEVEASDDVRRSDRNKRLPKHFDHFVLY